MKIKITIKKQKKNCGCGQDPCVTYGVQNEEKNFKSHKMYDPDSDDIVDAETEEEHDDADEDGYIHIDPETLRDILKDEGGAAGIDPFLDSDDIDADENEIRDALEVMDDVGQHKDGDYILADDEEIIVKILKEAVKFVLEKRKKKRKKKKKKKGNEICPKGIAWAKRNYDKWPSAYASMGASKYCKDSSYGKGKKTNEEKMHEEGDLKKWRDEKWVQSDGTPCGDSEAQSAPRRCKPKAKWASMTAAQKKADNAKKKAGGKKNKQYVSATKKGKVTKGYTKS